MSWPSAHTVNFCNNPRFQNDLSGCSSRGGASLMHEHHGARRVGDYSLWVSCPGEQSGEGALLANGLCQVTGLGCASFYLTSHDTDEEGTLNVVCIDQTAGDAVLGTASIRFDPDMGWQRIVLNNLSFVSGHEIAVYLETDHRQRCNFNVDCCQWEPQWSFNNNNTPTDYCDGDLQYGFWGGATDASLSFKLYSIQISASGNIASSSVSHLLNIGEIFYLVFQDPASGPTVDIGNVDLSGVQYLGLTGLREGGGFVNEAGFNYVLMVAGLSDFAIFAAGDVDPAQCLVGWNNAGITSGINTSGSAGYTRAFATFSAPQLFQGSTGANVWNQAAYFAVGYQVASMTASEIQHVTHVQTELVPNTGVPAIPTAYIQPRALSATLAPTVMNYVTNPSFETDTAGWTALSGTTMTRGTTQAWTGTYSAQMAGSSYIGAWINVPDLIVGEDYTASAYVYSTAVNSVTIAINPVSGFTYEFGIVNAITAASWQRVDVNFVATASSVNLALWGTGGWFLDAVMLNPGGLEAYGDGSFDGWNWESTVNDSRSYFYERGNIAYAAVQDVLTNHLPLGVSALSPVYNTPVTQYS